MWNKIAKVSLAVFGVVLVSMILPSVLFGAGVVLATTTVASATVTREGQTSGISPDHLQRDISSIVTEQKPDQFPLDTCLRLIRKARPAFNTKVEWETVTYRGNSVTMDAEAAFTTETSGNLTLVDSSDILVDDILYTEDVVPANGTSLGARMVVTAVVSSTVITVQALNGHDGSNGAGERLTTVPDETVLYRLGNMKTELDAQTDGWYKVPGNDYNFCQINMAQLEESKVAEKHKSYSGYDFADKWRQTIYDFRSNIEKDAIFGVRKEETIGSDTHYSMDGVVAKIGDTVNFTLNGTTPAPTLNETIDWAEQVFSQKAGSESRLVLVGSGLAAGIDKIPNYNREISANQVEIVHGVHVTELPSRFGTMYLKRSTTLDEMGWTNKGIILDLDHVYRHELEPLEIEELELDKAGSRRVARAYRILETAQSRQDTRVPTIRYTLSSKDHNVVHISLIVENGGLVPLFSKNKKKEQWKDKY